MPAGRLGFCTGPENIRDISQPLSLTCFHVLLLRCFICKMIMKTVACTASQDRVGVSAPRAPAVVSTQVLHLQLLLPADRRNGVVRSRRLSIHLAAPGALLTRPDAWNSSPWKSCRLAGSSSKRLKNCHSCHSSDIRLPDVVLRTFFFHSSLSCLSTMGGKNPSLLWKSALCHVLSQVSGHTPSWMYPPPCLLQPNASKV